MNIKLTKYNIGSAKAYLVSDIDPILASHAAEVARLRKALEDIADPQTTTDCDFWNETEYMRDIARTALNQGEK